MVEYGKVNLKLSNSQLNKLKYALRIKQEQLWKWISEFLMEIKKLSKAQISKMIQPGGFLRSLLSKLAGPLMKAAVPLANKILAFLWIIAAASAIDVVIKKNNYYNNYYNWNNYFNNFKQRNEWHNKIFSSSWRLKYFTKRSYRKILKWNKRTKRRIFRNVIKVFRS